MTLLHRLSGTDVMHWVRGTALAQWMLNRALTLHLRDEGRCRVGPAQHNIWGWIYFRLLCGIAYSKEYGT